jgi:hypothetical protein
MKLEVVVAPVVDVDIEAAREGLVAHGVEVSAPFHRSRRQSPVRPGERTARPRPAETGATMRLIFDSVEDLEQAMRRAAKAHGVHEEEIGEADDEWPIWYSQYMERERIERGRAEDV